MMSLPAAAPLPPPAPGGPAHARPRVSWPLVFFLATVTTLYMMGGYLARSGFGIGRIAEELSLTWLSQVLVCWAMVQLLVRGYPWAAHALGRITPRLAVLICGCAIAGMAAQGLSHGLRHGVWIPPEAQRLFIVFWNLNFAALLVVAHHLGQRSRRAAAALRDAEVERLAAQRESASARTQLLQAQVEPHFLFNALANVRRLLRTDSAGAKNLLADLLRYLEEALPRLREDETTLGREAELVRAFLSIHQVRMGARLHAEVDVPAQLADTPLPPMLLLTLVENALKHGLAPLVDGGRIEVRARVHAERPDRIVITVADTGRGMGSGSGHGTGLANARARLKSMYGAEAALSLAINEPRGVVAMVTLPRQAGA